MSKMKKGVVISYIALILIIAALFFIHTFKIYPLLVDKYTFFLTSLLFVLLMLPAVKSIKFFDLVEVRREYKMLKELLRK